MFDMIFLLKHNYVIISGRFSEDQSGTDAGEQPAVRGGAPEGGPWATARAVAGMYWRYNCFLILTSLLRLKLCSS